MPVPSTLAELSVNASENSPLGSESPRTADNYFRAHAAFIKQVDEKAEAALGGASSIGIDLAEPTGAAMVGSDDGAGGSLWANVAGYIARAQRVVGSVVHLRSYAGADPTGAANSSAAFLQAIADTPAGGTLLVDGNYRVGRAGEIGYSITKNLTIRGVDSGVGNISDGALCQSFLYFDQNNSDCSVLVNDKVLTLDGVTLSGLGHTIATGDGVRVTGDNSAIIMDGGSRIQSFKQNLRAQQGDYCRLNNGSLPYGQTSFVADGCYNVVISSGFMIRPEGVGSRGVVALNGSQITDYGASIESQQEYGIVLLQESKYVKFGGYFEGALQGGSPTSKNVWLSDGCTYAGYGVKYYLTGCDDHITTEGSGTARFTIIDEHPEFIAEPTSRRVDYYSFNPIQATGIVNVGRGAQINSSYVPGTNNNWVNPDFAALGAFRQGVGDYQVYFPEYNAGPMVGVDVDTRREQKSRWLAPYSASITPDHSRGTNAIIVTNGTAFTINAPVAPATTDGIRQILRIQIFNESGGAMGVITWTAGAGGLRLGTWTNPANGFNRTIEFAWDGSAWYEQSRTPLDVLT